MVIIGICLGCGLGVDDFGILEVKLRPGGGIACDNSGDADDGLYLSGSGSIGIVAEDSATIDFSGDGSSGSHLTASVKISGDACNGLTTGSDGKLYAHNVCTKAGGLLTGYLGATFPVSMTADAYYRIQNDGGDLSVTNPLSCEMIGIWDVQAYGGGVTMDAGSDAHAFLETDTDGGGYGISTPETYFRMDNRSSSGPTDYNINNLWERNYVHFNAGETHTLGAKVAIHITTGTATWYDSGPHGLAFPRFEFHWHFTPVGIC